MCTEAMDRRLADDWVVLRGGNGREHAQYGFKTELEAENGRSRLVSRRDRDVSEVFDDMPMS